MRRLALLATLLMAPAAAWAQNDDRAAAEWVLRNNGRVRLAGQTAILHTLDQLPTTPFRLEAVDLVGTTIEPSEFPKLSGCTKLKELLLPGPSFNPGAGCLCIQVQCCFQG